MCTALKILFLVSLIAPPAFAWPPEVAPEATFASEKMTRAWKAQANPAKTSNNSTMKVQKLFRDLVAERCPDCVITQLKDSFGKPVFRATLKSGWYMDITLDPGVIEIKTKPIPGAELDTIAPQMQRLIWDVAEELDLEVDGLGHLNFGIESTFGDDANLFYNFLVDYYNNPGFSLGVLGPSEIANAPHPEQLSTKQKAALVKVLDEFDPKTHTIQDFAKNLYKKVFYYSRYYAPAQKFQAANVTSIVTGGDSWPRLEMRALPMQTDAKNFVLLSKLFIARIEYLKKNPQKVKYRPEKFGLSTVFDDVKDFYLYVTESGLDWSEYRNLVSKDPDYQLALDGLDFYIEKGGMKSSTAKSSAPKNKAAKSCPKEFAALAGT